MRELVYADLKASLQTLFLGEVMAFSQKILTTLALLIMMTACAPKQVVTRAPAGSFDPKDLDGKVRFEAVNASGEFTASEMVEDPLKEAYEDEIWVASKASRTETIRSTTSLNRINLVFVGDGYTQTEMAQYAKDVETNTAKILLQEPFRTYQNYFAVHRVDVVSQVSGVSQENPGQVRDTALGMSYHCSGIPRLLCANLNRVMQEAQNAPKSDAVFVIANSATYGGAGYLSPAVATFAGRNKDSLELALHEFAHSFVGLTDEYDSAGVSANCPSFANVAEVPEADLLSKKQKWYRWLDLPQVSAFQGSCYSMKFYRPTQNSKMRTLGHAFDVVNAEQFVLRFYRSVRPIEFATSPGGLGSSGELEVVPMKPTGHSLRIEWKIDGVTQASLANVKKIFPRKLGLKPGAHVVSVTVSDPTTFVRDEVARQRDMSQTLSWTID